MSKFWDRVNANMPQPIRDRGGKPVAQQRQRRRARLLDGAYKPSRSLKRYRKEMEELEASGEADRILEVANAFQAECRTRYEGQVMNARGGAVDDARDPYDLARTTTVSGAGPTNGCPQAGSRKQPAPISGLAPAIRKRQTGL